MKFQGISLFLAGLGLYTAAGAVRADDVHCPPDIGAVTIDGNVLIAAPCSLDGTTVIGNVLLYTGGSLVARDVRIDGNVQAEFADFVDIASSYIGGDIQLDDMVGDRASITADSEIVGDIQLVKNRSALEVRGNRVNGDVQAFDNTNGIVISDNEIDGNLQCKENTPPPGGGNNIVQGNSEDQCADLSSAGSRSGASANGAVSLQALDTAGSNAAAAPGTSSGGGSADLLSIGLLGTMALALARRRRSGTA